MWALNPLHWINNINGFEEVRWQDYNTLRNPKLFEMQARHARKIVEETNKYDNIIYEICNEPGGFNDPTEANLPSPAEVDEWQMAIAGIIREADSGLPHKHLISGQEAFAYDPFLQSSLKSFRSFGIDIVNMHPLPNTTYGETAYPMGEFMMKQLKLRSLRDYCLATYSEPKPLNFDEDNAASQYKDFDGWTIHRKRAWTTLMGGAHYDYIDFSIINYVEAGTSESQRHIRSWFGYLSRFIHSIDLISAKPSPDIVKDHPAHTCPSAILTDNGECFVYLADERELDEIGCGTLIEGTAAVDLPQGDYLARFFSPVTGEWSPFSNVVADGHVAHIEVEFAHDVLVHITPKEPKNPRT